MMGAADLYVTKGLTSTEAEDTVCDALLAPVFPSLEAGGPCGLKDCEGEKTLLCLRACA